jgi:hypothetical protein
VNEENLAQNSTFRRNSTSGIEREAARNPIITLVRKGLLNAIVVNCDEESDLAWNICMKFRDYGLLAKQRTVTNSICTAIGYHRITNSGMFGYHRKSFKRF